MNPSRVVRENSGLLADAERRVLISMAARLPQAISSDHLTTLAVVGTIVAGAGFWMAGSLGPASWLVVLGLLINWFGDSLDGTVARVRDQQRPRYGYYLDHVLDTFGMLVLFAGMTLGGFLTPLVALATLVAYYLLSIEVYLATHALGTFRMAFWRVGPTELRILLAAATLAVVVLRPKAVWFGVTLHPFDIGAMAAMLGMLITAIRSAIVNTRTLYRLEPLQRSVQSRT